MKTKSGKPFTWWDPHATSTPLKKISNQLNVRSDVQKQWAPETDSDEILKKLQESYNYTVIRDRSAGAKVQVPKRTKKNRLSVYFDLSSSSDDESEVQKRPIIKLSSKKNSKLLLRDKEPESKEADGLNTSATNKPNIKNKSPNLPAVEISKCKSSQTLNKKSKTEKKIDSCVEKVCGDSDEENVIFTKCTKSKTNSKALKKTANTVSHSKNDLHSRHPSDFTEVEKQRLQRVSKSNLLKPKPLEENHCNDPQGLESQQRATVRCQKRKTKKETDGTAPVKKRSKKAASRAATPPLKAVVSTAKAQLSQNKSNLSHQLFSDTAEQEYIDTLDLASDEVEKAAEGSRCVQAKRKPADEAPAVAGPSSQGSCCENEGKVKRPRRRQQAPLEFWMPQVKLCPAAKGQNGAESRKVQGVKPVSHAGPKEVTSEKASEEESSGNRGGKSKKKQTVNAADNKTAANAAENGSDVMKITQNGSNGSSKSLELNEKIDLGDQKKERLKCLEVFKRRSEVEFGCNGAGCSVVECWSTEKFKCGVFKLKPGCRFTCKTLNGRSHMGGVVVKGSLRMKVGGREQELEGGDMAFVPPLTEWEATNAGEDESEFYYWCGSFES